jgi:hypothetical protein
MSSGSQGRTLRREVVSLFAILISNLPQRARMEHELRAEAFRFPIARS